MTWTALKPTCRCFSTLASTKRANAEPSPLGEPKDCGGAGAFDSSSCRNSRWSTEKSRSSTQSPLSSSSTIARTSSMPTLSTSTLMRARARLTRSQSWRSKMRKTASAHLRYSPSSAVTKSTSVGAIRGMIDVPPPTRISKPLTPSRSRAMKAMSWMPVSARSVSDPVNAVLTLRGMSCVVGWRTK